MNLHKLTRTKFSQKTHSPLDGEVLQMKAATRLISGGILNEATLSVLWVKDGLFAPEHRSICLPKLRSRMGTDDPHAKTFGQFLVVEKTDLTFNKISNRTLFLMDTRNPEPNSNQFPGGVTTPLRVSVTRQDSFASEIWKPVKFYEGFYEISNFGRCRRIRTHTGKPRNNLLTPSICTQGYYQYQLVASKLNRRSLRLAHKLVYESFVGEMAWGLEINHKNGDKLDNRIENLETITHQANIAHAVKNGLINRYTRTISYSLSDSAIVTCLHCKHGWAPNTVLGKRTVPVSCPNCHKTLDNLYQKNFMENKRKQKI